MHSNIPNPFRDEIEKAVARLAQEAGRRAMRHFRSVKAHVKRDGSIVTDADREIERFLFDAIMENWPESSFIGEESEYRKAGSLLWVVDPIDGTAMFAVGAPTWVISIAVFSHSEPLAAAVYCPVTDELFSMSDGRFVLNGEPVAAAGFLPSPRSVLYVPSNFARDYGIADYDGKILNLGSGCLHIANVLSGRGDAVVLRGHIWDIAPAFPFVSKSGAGICDLTGKRISAADVLDFGRQKVEFPILISSCQESAEYFVRRLSYRTR